MKRNVLVALFALFALFAPFSGAYSLEDDESNNTVYYLSNSEAKVVQPVNGCSFNLTLPAKSEIFLFDSEGGEVPIEVDDIFWRGSYRYKITSNRSVEGHLNYTLPLQDQRFSIIPISEGSIKIVLPRGYSTSDHLLGRPRPSPDEIGVEEGRTTLIWQDPGERVIEVNYYKENAPRAFRLFLLLLVFLAGLLALEHILSMKRLRAMTDEADRDQ